jgi:hypothetical protein
MSALSWEDRFSPIDRVVADMPPIANACSTCAHAEIPPMPENPDDGWIAHCRAPVPVNALFHITEVQRSFAAADAARWDSKRQSACPAWQAVQKSTDSEE